MSRVAPDLTGQRFGLWTLIERVRAPGQTCPKYLAQCDCGSEPRLVIAANVQRGISRSCGCSRLIPKEERVIDRTAWAATPLSADEIAAKAASRRERRLATLKRHNDANRAKRSTYNRRRWLLVHFGLTPEAYEAMVAKQDGGCAICRKCLPSGKRFAVDHCHRTGRVRGLLCMLCNTALGKLGDDVELLARAIDYLRSHAN